jgi:hypothetical protein
MEMSENKLKEILTGQREEYQLHVDNQLDKQRDEYQRFLGVMKEDFDSKMQLIGEQFHDVKTTQASHSEMIGSMMETSRSSRTTFSSQRRVKKKVDYEEFESLVKRVSCSNQSRK